jgi:endonuclease I
MKIIPRIIALALLLGLPSRSTASPPADYYAGVDSTSATALRKSLHEIINDHQRIPYSTESLDTWFVLERADQDPDNPDNILDLYQNTSYPKYGGRNEFYNQEHCWPTSYGFPRYRIGNYPFTDCHAMFMCDLRYNTSRGNKPYSECGDGCQEKQTSSGGDGAASDSLYPGESNWTTGAHIKGAWETWLGRRGDVARALFYLDVRYEGGRHLVTDASEPDLILTDDKTLIARSDTGENEPVAYMGLLSILLKWHRQDPVDDMERRRNDVVFRFQGNRNPFIDHPEWVEIVFGR